MVRNKIWSLLIPVTVVGTLLASIGPAGASTTKPSPSWTLSPVGNGKAKLPALSGACHGHSDAPWTASDRGVAGIAYSANQTCTGAFVLQRVCVSLEERDYYGDFLTLTGSHCGSFTSDSYTSYGRWAGCAAGHGVYRTKSQGIVEWVEGLPETATGASTSATLC